MTEMNKKAMIDSWKNPEARKEGTVTPVGNVALNEDDLNAVAGGFEGTHAYDTNSCCTTSKFDTGHCCDGDGDIIAAL